MKLLVDENLPPRLAAWLCERGHDAVHVLDARLGGRSDADLAEHAAQSKRTLVTKDTDFDDMSIPVIRLAIGNVSTTLLAWLEPQLEAALKRLTEGERLVIVS